MSLDPATEQMLAKPELLADPLFSKDAYLAQAGQYLLGTYLFLMKQTPEVCQQAQLASADSNSHCMKVRIAHLGKHFLVIAWTYDFEARGPDGVLGRDVWIERSKPSDKPIINSTTNMLLEQVLVRRVVNIQVEDEQHKPQPIGGGYQSQIVRLKHLGWYVAGLVPPVRQGPPVLPQNGPVVGAVPPPSLNVNRNVVGPVPAVPQPPQHKKNWWKFW